MRRAHSVLKQEPETLTIRSYIDSAKKQGIGMLHALQAAFAGTPLELA